MYHTEPTYNLFLSILLHFWLISGWIENGNEIAQIAERGGNFQVKYKNMFQLIKNMKYYHNR